MPRRIYRDAKFEEVYQKFYDGEEALFNQLKDVFLVAACVGFKMGKRKPLCKRGKELHWDVFNRTDQSIINAIALAETDDVKVLIDDCEEGNDRITIVEEYANSGIEFLKSEVLDKGGSPSENLLSFLYSQKENNMEGISSLGLLAALGDEL